MRRREFVTLAGLGIAAWPCLATARDEQVRRIAVLVPGAEGDSEVIERGLRCSRRPRRQRNPYLD